MNIAAYCRVSTNKEDQINSLETQKSFFEGYAKKNNYNLVKIYADEGISGTKIKNRKEFLKMMRDSEGKLFEMVVVKDISRLARNAVDFLQGIRTLKVNGVACNFVNTNLTSQDSEMILGTLALVAQEESANTSKRIKMSKKINAERGRVPNIVYGYDKINGDYFNLNINPGEADIVRRIFKMYVYEGYGANKISLILNAEGIKTKRDNKWSQNAVSRILNNKIYIGKIINGKEEVADFLTGVRTARDDKDWFITEKPELRIVDNDIFNKASAILKERYNAFNIKHERHSNRHIFSTLIKCKDCGYSFRRRVRTYKHTYVDWVCGGRNANGADSCSNKTTLYEFDLINSIENYFAELLNDKPNALNNIVSKFNKIYKTNDDDAILEQELKNKLNRLNHSKQKVMDMYEDDVISREEMRGKMSGINLQIEKVNNDIKIMECNLNKGELLESILTDTFKDIESITSLNEITNAQLKRIIEKIVVDERGNVNIYLKLFSDTGLSEVNFKTYN